VAALERRSGVSACEFSIVAEQRTKTPLIQAEPGHKPS
jgi:hypothetical protein